MARGDEPLKQAAFLAAYAQCGVISHACIAAEIDARRHYDWLENDVDGIYEEKFAEARDHASGLLELEARRRAIEGVTETIFWQGLPVGTKTKYSDTLLMFLLKGSLPDKYAERKQISGTNGGPLEIHEEIVIAGEISDDDEIWGDVDTDEPETGLTVGGV